MSIGLKLTERQRHGTKYVNMADEKNASLEEAKWWIERGPVKERPKEPYVGRGIIEKWAQALLKDYNQDQASRNVVDINRRVLHQAPLEPGQWGYVSLGVGNYSAAGLAKIKNSFKLPQTARAVIVDAGYSVRVLITDEPIGERIIDINFTPAPSLDYWVSGELVEEKTFSSIDDALKKLKTLVPTYL
ncbi:MAG: hypothetical protein HY695_03985 [Deltaproteobacteria bacterium]|nr:hypothetical protein [Deltaproteobacteria bacterium]